MYLKYLWLLTILFYLKHHHSPSPELLDTEGLLLGYCSAPLYFSIAVFTQDSWYYSTPLSEPKTFLKAGLQSFQHYPHLATKDSSAAPARFYSIREQSGCGQGQPNQGCVGDQTLQAHALKMCLEGVRGT